MADLDRFDLDDQYAGKCQVCGESMYDDGDNDHLGREYVHRACKEDVEREQAELFGPDWSQE